LYKFDRVQIDQVTPANLSHNGNKRFLVLVPVATLATTFWDSSVWRKCSRRHFCVVEVTSSPSTTSTSACDAEKWVTLFLKCRFTPTLSCSAWWA